MEDQRAKQLLEPVGLLPLARVLRKRLSPVSPTKARQRRAAKRFYAQLVGKGDLVFDIGANMGSRTEVFLKLGARVVCVEPQKACVDQLRKLFGENRRVTIVDKALGEMECTSTLMVCDDADTLSTMSDKWVKEGRFSGVHTWSRKQEIAVTTLDGLIHQHGVPKLCKIDVEGFEIPVLKGLSSPVPIVSFEFTKEFLEDALTCMKHLSSLGEVRFNCSIGESMRLSYDDWMTSQDLYSKLELIDDTSLCGDIYARSVAREEV